MNKLKILVLVLLFCPFISFGQAATEIAKRAISSTVSVIALDNTSQPFAYGSGFIIDYNLIATNVHVIEGASSAYILINGASKNLAVEGYVAIDKANDLVILKVRDLNGTKLTLSSKPIPEIGEKIYAVGNPKNLSGTFSEGIVSGIRDINGNKTIQITAPISPGSSGGPVLNLKGEVIGIAFASLSSGQNLNFAIPVKYLEILKSNTSTAKSLTSVKKAVSANKEPITNPNINDGVVIRNLITKVDHTSDNQMKVYGGFSIKNNLPSAISDIDVLILVYDNTGTVVDYKEETFFHNNLLISEDQGIKPNLARTLTNVFYLSFGTGYKVQARILNFKYLDN